jgi:hypothetical protein
LRPRRNGGSTTSLTSLQSRSGDRGRKPSRLWAST